MREILFHGKRTDNGEWVEGYLVIKCDPLIGIYYYYIVLQHHGESFADWFLVDCETVGQYTGRNDKNGKKIFDGDICQINNHPLIDNTPFVVEWEDFVYNGWVWRDLDEDGSEDSFTEAVARSCEIIGNIHDNPELLWE